jgi:hypothetical protein
VVVACMRYFHGADWVNSSNALIYGQRFEPGTFKNTHQPAARPSVKAAVWRESFTPFSLSCTADGADSP